jgi:hypothetical protein
VSEVHCAMFLSPLFSVINEEGDRTKRAETAELSASLDR